MLLFKPNHPTPTKVVALGSFDRQDVSLWTPQQIADKIHASKDKNTWLLVKVNKESYESLEGAIKTCKHDMQDYSTIEWKCRYIVPRDISEKELTETKGKLKTQRKKKDVDADHIQFLLSLTLSTVMSVHLLIFTKQVNFESELVKMEPNQVKNELDQAKSNQVKKEPNQVKKSPVPIKSK